MTRNWLIVLFAATVLVLTLTVLAAAYWFSPAQYDALGSLFGAAASFLAVIWFSGSLYFQSIQLKEQREQFSLELKEQREQFSQQFKQLREDARRNALTLAKDILLEAEQDALKANPSLSSINDLSTLYLDWSEMKVIMESTDPVEVQEAIMSWSKKEGPAMTLIAGVKVAAEVYLRAIDRTDIDYSIDADDFVFIHGPTLWKLPYFGRFGFIGSWLTEFMIRIQPGRKAAILASTVAQLKLAPQIMNKEKITQSIERHRTAGLPLPAIAEDIK
jgi:hypothetical protein